MNATPIRTDLWKGTMTGGYAADVAIVPAKRLGLVVLSNTASSEVDKFASGVLKELLAHQ